MPFDDELSTILDRITYNQHTAEDLEILRNWLSGGRQLVSQSGKYAVNLGQGQDIHVGDRTYTGTDAETIREICRTLLQELQLTSKIANPEPVSINELVKQVRSQFHYDIQHLHGTMPLWGVDHWVPLSDLFVDVNVLEELSSSGKSELDDLWQIFTAGTANYSSYRSLDRIGVGKERNRVSGIKILDNDTNLVVVGKPGSGKTTYLQSVAIECNAGTIQEHRIPALIKLRDFVDDGRSVEYSLKRYLSHCWRLSEVEIVMLLQQGRGLILLDGLDEVTGEVGKAIAKQIKQFVREFPQNQVVVTCRTQILEAQFDWKSLRFQFVEIADFDENQVRLFADHWFKAVDHSASATPQNFLVQLFLEDNKPIRELAITPILLNLTCAVFYRTGKFYSKRSKLYEEGLELLLEQWDKSREIERDEIYRDLTVDRKIELLSYLAVKKFEQPQYVLFKQSELEDCIAEFLNIGKQESRVVLKSIEAQHGLLIERSQKVWSFSHLTFQEHFVARFFSLENNDWQRLASQIRITHWREVFLLAIEMINNVEELLELMRENIDLMAAEDQKLCQFIYWISRKQSSIKTFYRSAAVRAFYFVANSTLYVPYGGEIDFSLALILDFEHGYARAATIGSPLLKDLTLTPIQANKGVYALNLDCDLAIDSMLSSALSIANSFSACNKNSSTPVCPPSELARELSVHLSRSCALDPTLNTALSTLKSQLPEPNEDDETKLWWHVNSHTWVNQLRVTMIKYRNLGQDWQLSNKQKQLFKQYYDANRILVDCLHDRLSTSTM